MSSRPESLPLTPDATAAAGGPPLPRQPLRGPAYRVRTLYTDQLSPISTRPRGAPQKSHPGAALVVATHIWQGSPIARPPRPSAVARIGKCPQPLLAYPGFDFTLPHHFRQRLLTHAAAQRPLDTSPTTCKARGWIKTRATQLRIPRMSCGDPESPPPGMRPGSHASCAQPAQRPTPPAPSSMCCWVVCPLWPSVGPGRLPKDASKREALARQMG